MVRLILALLVAVAPLACTQSATGEDPDAYDEGCTGSSGTHGVFDYAEAWIVDPAEPQNPLWEAPRQACELSTIIDLDIADDGAVYALGTAFLHKEICEGTCPWRYWLRRISAEGEEEWKKTFKFPELDLRSVRAVTDGVVIGGAATVGQDQAPWLAGFDAAGTLLWQDIFAEHGEINAIARGPDDVMVAVGSVEAGGATDLWAVQVTADGATGWTSTLGDERHESGVAVVVDAARRAWIVGGRYTYPIDEYLDFYPMLVPEERHLGPTELEFHRSFEQPLVALLDDQGALLWSDEPAPLVMDTTPVDGGLGIGLLPEGDAIVGVSGFWVNQQWIARYAADGSRVWETLVTPTGESTHSVDELVCDALGRTHVLLSYGVIVQIDDAGNVIGTLEPHTNGDQIALTPTGALRVSQWRYRGGYYESWGTGG